MRGWNKANGESGLGVNEGTGVIDTLDGAFLICNDMGDCIFLEAQSNGSDLTKQAI